MGFVNYSSFSRNIYISRYKLV